MWVVQHPSPTRTRTHTRSLPRATQGYPRAWSRTPVGSFMIPSLAAGPLRSFTKRISFLALRTNAPTPTYACIDRRWYGVRRARPIAVVSRHIGVFFVILKPRGAARNFGDGSRGRKRAPWRAWEEAFAGRVERVDGIQKVSMT